MNKCAPIKNNFQKEIESLEKAMLKCKGVKIGHEADEELCPLEHFFADGIYIRKIFMPAGTIVTSKIHKYSHPYFILKGKCDVQTKDGLQQIIAPYYGITEAGTKRAIIVKEDTVWITCHLNITNTQNLQKIEEVVIAKSFEEFNEFNKIKNIKNKLLNAVKYMTEAVSKIGKGRGL